VKRQALIHPQSVFRAVLPTPAQTLLLKFCLQDGENALEAWKKWCQHDGNPEILLRFGPRSVRGLNVLLSEALHRHGVSQTHTAFKLLRMSVLKEELRYSAYRQTLNQTLTALKASGISFVVLKGAALAETVYAHPGQRHCHDIDLLIRDKDVHPADVVLARLDYQTEHPRRGGDRHIAYVHSSELPLELHIEPLRVELARRLVQPFWSRTCRTRIAGASADVLAPEDNLVHVLAIAFFSPFRFHLRWVTDAWFIINRTPDFNWESFLATAHIAQLSMAFSVMLTYLAETLDAPVPETILERLSEAMHQEAFGREIALYAVWSEKRRKKGAKNAFTVGKHMRRLSVRWPLRPTPNFLCFAYEAKKPLSLVGIYLIRAFRFLSWSIRCKLQLFFHRGVETQLGFTQSPESKG